MPIDQCPTALLPVAADNFRNYAMVLLALKARNADNSYNPVHTFDSDWYTASVNCILARFIHAHAEQSAEAILVAGPGAVLVPAARTPTQNNVALSRDPILMILDGTWSNRSLEKNLPSASEGDGDESGLLS